MEVWCGMAKPSKAPKKKGPRRGKSQVDRAADEAKVMQTSNDWGAAHARHLVGLYVLCHRHVYRVEPEELAKDWPGACSAARRLVEQEFGGELCRAVAFLRWTWAKEIAAEKRRDASSSFRIGWRLQFMAKNLLTDYRLHLARSVRGTSPTAAQAL